MLGSQNQLSRYGAIAKEYPFVLGKLYFLLSSTEALEGRMQRDFPVDFDGENRLFSSWATVIAAVTAGNGDAIAVSPNFTTAPTLAQCATLDAAGVSVFQLGQVNLDGSYFATKAGAGSAGTNTPASLFQINGKVELLSIVGEVTTVFASGTNNQKLTMVPTVGPSQDICATADTASSQVGTLFSISGYFADALQVSTPNVIGKVIPASSTPVTGGVILPAGVLKWASSAVKTGASKWRITYRPLDPGAFISAL